MSDSQIDAICICTENSRHESLAREALQAEKHVLSEYPLAFSKKGLSELLDLALQQKRVLHVPPIALLSSSHAEAKQKIRSLGKLEKGHFIFTASSTRMDGPLPFLTFPRLMQIGDFFGEFTIKDWQQESKPSGIIFKGKLQLHAGGIVTFEESHVTSLKRSRQLMTEQSLGKFVWNYHPKTEGLFEKDLDQFFQRITQNAPCYYDSGLFISLTAELERISHEKN